MDLTTLPTLTALSNCVTMVEKDNVKIVRIIHDKAVAGIALHGGHVLSFQPKGQPDLIWMSSDTLFDGKAALRGGIPVCWPWFGRIAAPAHGFARSTEWTLVEHRENEQGVMISLGLETSEQTLAIWPHHFQIRLLVEIRDTLQVTLEIINTDKKEWVFSGALHTYLNVGDIRQTETTGMGLEYLDNLNHGQKTAGTNSLVLTDTIDRVYTQPEAQIRVKDPVLNRTLLIKNHGHNSAVLWNPWSQGAQAMADMDNEGYQTMLCVESTWHANSLEEGKTLQPGERYQLSTTLSAQ
ncbi:Aldose 1-epimerase [Vibrio cincinnatiensis]|uniref:Putative glucose-6-phosphate 1-epimerase n=1 Tax=Vibrio cincinnatiensis DSM 19608 TaxID=1123491 RepID=A0A1T4M955_VIBCI|nr:D-hexose-6-phosphate mutarotase [Vibrio cincinnatiensis]SJZ63529.1 glucose-6-phosphate 1-epimerase [Vibrio cincinnatiensis DSM 19608]SUP48088.1 Aldose 1-epimerase [Vibrio cincinnatiensis]